MAARVKQVNVRDGQTVAQGDVLIELESPDMASRLTIVRREIEIQQLQMRRQAGRSETAADAGIIEQQLAEAVAEGRMGVSKSLLGRVEMLGGVAALDTDESGTEWEIRVPKEPT